MSTDLDRYLARVILDPAYAPYAPEHAQPRGPVVIVGYHAAFATHPAPGTALAAFPGIDLATTTVSSYPLMGLVRIEHATEVVTVHRDGSTSTEWHDTVFSRLPRGISWRLVPAEPAPVTGRPRTVAGWWAAGGRQALLPRSVTTQVPGAPTAVKIHDHDPHTGRRWPS
ncbi:hypothetical protein IU510_30035 [Nocardia cyriacigeorgica]|uniref:hypothetical protein n=1 Tax=Nocardia cyriacigeorgica TaxID=135487 RepID=UPI0018931A16|nr:hypothetical protein [Nocardia cyriacigeorgica]MBF6102261.1 hypothetical protein [Nocardia cyriacigeorgica]